MTTYHGALNQCLDLAQVVERLSLPTTAYMLQRCLAISKAWEVKEEIAESFESAD